MIKFVLFILSKGLAFSCGAGVLSLSWLVGTLFLDYVSAIFSASESVPDGNFRKLSGNEFRASELNIKMATAKKIIVSAIFFGLGYLALYLRWV